MDKLLEPLLNLPSGVRMAIAVFAFLALAVKVLVEIRKMLAETRKAKTEESKISEDLQAIRARGGAVADSSAPVASKDSTSEPSAPADQLFLTPQELARLEVAFGILEALATVGARWAIAVATAVAATLLAAVVVAMFKEWMLQAVMLVLAMAWVAMLSALWSLERRPMREGKQLAKTVAKSCALALGSFLVLAWLVTK